MSTRGDKSSTECKELTRDKKEGERPDNPHFADLLWDEVKGKNYSIMAAYACSVASGWAYAEKNFLETIMKQLGWEFTDETPKYISITNDALLLRTTVYWLRSGSVGILCFRGTEPTNVISWLSDMSIEMEQFRTVGKVHRGFLSTVSPVIPTIAGWLDEASKESPALPHTPRSAPLDTLLICGHSLGGAQAVLATAMLYGQPQFARFRDKVHGVYCFGQPLVGDEKFSEWCEDRFGHLLFRHTYEKDPIPYFPPRLYGSFTTFGQEYMSTSGKCSTWTRSTRTPRRAYTLVTSVVLGGFAWYLKQIPLLRGIRIPYNLYDHMPSNYIACSRHSFEAFK